MLNEKYLEILKGRNEKITTNLPARKAMQNTTSW